MRGRISRPLLVATALALVAAVVPAQISGTWDVQVDVTLPAAEPAGAEVAPDCQYTGTGMFTPGTGGSFTGSLDLNLVMGDTNICPGTLSGAVTGTEDTSGNISGTIDGGANLGTLDFTGQPTPTMIAQAAAPNLGGRFTVRQGGPFGSAAGTWAGQQQTMPALGPLALAVLGALLVVGGSLVLRRRRQAV